MVLPGQASTARRGGGHCGRSARFTSRWRQVLLPLTLLLCACAGSPLDPRPVAALPSLQLDSGAVRVEDVALEVTTPDLLATDAAMRAFVERHTAGIVRPRQRLFALHQAIRGFASLGIDYDPAAEGTATEVFHRGRANCLSYASMFIALARQAGLQARYQWLRVRPQWTVRGERVLVRLHVNALVNVGRHGQFMVDIDPLPTRDIAGSRTLSDADAQALYHSNIAMEALAVGAARDAWLHSVRALQLSPQMPHLWVNLGAIYRQAGQHGEAEANYLHALQLDPGNDSAMNNLVVLYGLQGREAERALWERRVDDYRKNNPYFHAWLGEQAAGQNDWEQALVYYEKALQLLPQDSRLLFALGNVHYALGQRDLATGYVRRAIEQATLRSDIDAYRQRLRAMQSGQSARAGAAPAPG